MNFFPIIFVVVRLLKICRSVRKVSNIFNVHLLDHEQNRTEAEPHYKSNNRHHIRLAHIQFACFGYMNIIIWKCVVRNLSVCTTWNETIFTKVKYWMYVCIVVHVGGVLCVKQWMVIVLIKIHWHFLWITPTKEMLISLVHWTSRVKMNGYIIPIVKCKKVKLANCKKNDVSFIRLGSSRLTMFSIFTYQKLLLASLASKLSQMIENSFFL